MPSLLAGFSTSIEKFRILEHKIYTNTRLFNIHSAHGINWFVLSLICLCTSMIEQREKALNFSGIY